MRSSSDRLRRGSIRSRNAEADVVRACLIQCIDSPNDELIVDTRSGGDCVGVFDELGSVGEKCGELRSGKSGDHTAVSGTECHGAICGELETEIVDGPR